MSIHNPRQNVSDTLCFRWGKCNWSWTSSRPQPLPPPPEQCWVLQVKQLLHILYTLRTLTLFRGGWGWGKIILRPLAAIPYKNTWKGGGVPKPFGQDCSRYRSWLVPILIHWIVALSNFWRTGTWDIKLTVLLVRFHSVNTWKGLLNGKGIFNLA